MKRYLRHIGYLLGIHATGLVLLSVLRLALFLAGRHFLTTEGLALSAFVRGLWFDNVIACYILIVPLVVLSLISVWGKGIDRTLRFCRWWMVALWTIAIAVSAANIPYFLYFFKNINSSIWNWAEYGLTTLGMLFGEPSYYPPMLGAIALVALLIWLSGKTMPRKTGGNQGLCWKHLLIAIPAIGLCVFGIRGRRGYNPIKVSAAYYCEDAFLNQLGVNPTFNLLTTTLDDRRPENKRLHLMEDEEALKNVQSFLQCQGTDEQPLRRMLEANDSTPAKGKNVVIILMESMSYDLLGKGQTPFLDSLQANSLTYTNCYSAGNHTNHGMYATLYSYPAILFRNLMKGSNIPLYSGLPTVLKQQGYRNLFFMTHESQYDNMNAFFRTNGYDDIYSQEDYPKDKVVNSFGVQDDFLYAYAIQRLKTQTTPFFATLLSISNHPPYVIPDYFHPTQTEPELQIVEYTDWSLRRFFDAAKTQPWYDNTIFVLLGDHGKMLQKAEDEMPQCLNHIPLMFHIPGMTPRQDERWALQMDIQPTLLGLMGIAAVQNNFGVDLRRVERPCAIYTSDNAIGARSEGHLYVFNPSTKQEFRYLNNRPTKETDSTFQALKEHAFSMLQAAEYVVGKGKTK